MNPRVTVIVFAYNHEKYLRRAIESVLAQTGDFSRELLVVYTPSADGTAQVADEVLAGCSYARRVDLDPRQSFAANTQALITSAKGHFLTFLDGDDYWCYDRKLADSMAFLENNPDYIGVFHDMRIESEPVEGEPSATYTYYRQYRSFSQFNVYTADYMAWDAVRRLIIPPSALLLYTDRFKAALDEFIHVAYSGMWMTNLFILRNGKYRYLNETWSVYRNHPHGITKKKPHRSFINDNIRVLRSLLKDDYYRKIRWDVYKSISKEYEYLMYSHDFAGFGKWDRVKIVWRMYAYFFRYVFWMARRALGNKF